MCFNYIMINNFNNVSIHKIIIFESIKRQNSDFDKIPIKFYQYFNYLRKIITKYGKTK